jgi:putative flippase GtrA
VTRGLAEQCGFFYAGAFGSFLITLVLTVLLTSLLGLNYVLSSALSLFTAATLTFFLHKEVTFRVSGKPLERFLRFLAILSAVVAVNSGTVFLISSGAGVHYAASVICVGPLTTAMNFILSRRWAFHRE